MPSLLARLLLTVWCLCASPLWAANTVPDNAIVLNDQTPVLEVNTPIQTWIDEGSHANIDLVASGAARFTPAPALGHFSLNKYNTLWIKLRLVRAPNSQAAWTLNLPLPFVDMVALYQLDSNGQWNVQRAGDTLPHSEWRTKGLYPDFDLQINGDAPHDVYLQVRNFKQVGLPIRLATGQQRDGQRQVELLSLGLMLGALLSLAALSILRYLEHRKAIDGWASLFGLLVAATIAQISGVLNAFLWSNVPELGNLASSTLPVIAVGCALLFIRNVFSLFVHYHRFDRFLSSVGWGTIASVLAFAVMDRFVADRVCGMIMLFATVVGLIAVFLSWRGGSMVARWLMLALAPQFLGLIYMVGEAIGMLPVLWEVRYWASLGIALTVPIMLYALSHITHDRKELVVRANHLPTQDALTGLLTAEVFQTHLEEAVLRAIENREPLALVVVRVVNHDKIREVFSDTTGEQCLLRAVVKIQRILRDVDPAGRVGTAQFGLLMEGVSTRKALTERMVKLIASGLIPLPGLVPEVTLQFQAACVLLHEIPVPAERVLDDLSDLLESMSPHTRRPIRFLEAVPTEASELHTQSPSD